ncbi:hypothetical protein ACVMYR_18840 [Micromonospora sp. PTRAS2]
MFRLRRDVYAPDGQRVSKQILHGVTSLTSRDRWLRAHLLVGGKIKIHWVRDILLGEDTHHAYLGGVAHPMAALRNLAIALIRLAGHTRIQQAMERHHASKMLIPALLDASRP